MSCLSNKASVTVVIVNWNCGSVLQKCLDHLLLQTFLPTRIIVVDNNSSDNSYNEIPQNDRIVVVSLDSNLGFAAANNMAISMCDSEYIALLNPDAFPNSDWLERLFSTAESYPEIDAFASLQLNDAYPSIIDGVGDSYHVSGRVWRNLFGVHLSFARLDKKDKGIFSPCAAAALYSRRSLIEAGGFDEDYFCYVEDVDLGFRLRLAGHQAMYVHDAVVRHVGSASTGGQHSDFCVYHGHRNLVWTYIKNMPGVLFWLLLPAHLFLNFISIGYFAMKGQGSVILRAKYDALKGIPKMWRKRRTIQNNRVATINDIWQVLDKRLCIYQKRE